PQTRGVVVGIVECVPQFLVERPSREPENADRNRRGDGQHEGCSRDPPDPSSGPCHRHAGLLANDQFPASGCSSTLRKKISAPCDCRLILPREGFTFTASLTTLPLSVTVMRSPWQVHTSVFHSPVGFSTSPARWKSVTFFQSDPLPSRRTKP